MAEASVWICHHARLVGECLGRQLAGPDVINCRWFEPAEFLQEAADNWRATCELLVLDAAIPLSTLALVATQLRHRAPQSRLLLLVPDAAIGRLSELSQLSSQGCVPENCSLDMLHSAVHSILTGKQFYDADLANALMAQLNGATRENAWATALEQERLTPREREILELIAAECLSNKQIARRLHVSLYTVKNHVHNIIEKLAVSDRHGAARLAQKRNLIWTA